MVPDKIPTYHLSKADLENYLKDLFPVEKDDIKVKVSQVERVMALVGDMDFDGRQAD